MRGLLILLFCLIAFAIGLVAGKALHTPADPVSDPVEDKPRLAMELFAVTPHGHQVYRKIENTRHGYYCVYVVVRAGDGYPIGIANGE